MKWSYSGWSMFKQCPRKFKEIRIEGKFKQADNHALRYGKDSHKAAELYIKDRTPLPPKFQFMQPYLDCLDHIPGTKHCELELGLAKGLEPCAFDAPDVWWHGIADLAVEGDGVIHLLDYKSGASSRYADLDQLEILSLALFKHFPKVNKIKAALLFFVAEDLKDEVYHRKDTQELWLKWITNIQRIEDAERTGVYNPIPNFTCRKYCPVESCEHCGE